MKTISAHLHSELDSNKRSHKDYCNDKGHSSIFLRLQQFQFKENRKETSIMIDLADFQEPKELLIINCKDNLMIFDLRIVVFRI
jgi:hypothetical protein